MTTYYVSSSNKYNFIGLQESNKSISELQVEKKISTVNKNSKAAVSRIEEMRNKQNMKNLNNV